MAKNNDVRGFLSVLKPYVIKFVCGVCAQMGLHSQRAEEIIIVAREPDISTAAFDLYTERFYMDSRLGKRDKCKF